LNNKGRGGKYRQKLSMAIYILIEILTIINSADHISTSIEMVDANFGM
jgi:hypothetical protein